MWTIIDSLVLLESQYISGVLSWDDVREYE